MSKSKRLSTYSWSFRMKSKHRLRSVAFGLFGLCLFSTGCGDDFLVEKPVSTLTTDVYYKTETGFEDLVKSCYPLLRNIYQTRALVLNGTDIFSSGTGWSASQKVDPDALDVYDTRLNGANGELLALWRLLYAEIGRANTVISRAPDVAMDESRKNIRTAEARFLRALCYFYLVQQWGDVPMPLVETTTASKEANRAPSKDVYKQIIDDLTQSETRLPVTASDYGRVTKGAARFLLSRVYLTRGWNFNNALGGSDADFQKALEYADMIIESYPLAARYKDLFPTRSENPLTQYTGAQNDKNPEIIFSVQYNSDVLTNKTDPAFPVDIAGGNNLHSIFGGGGEGFAGSVGRTSDYNRYQSHHIVTPAVYRMFDPDLDTRYDHNFVEVGYALSNVSNFLPVRLNPNNKINIIKGDTVCYFRPWNNPATTLDERGLDIGGKMRYAVINVDEYGGAYSRLSGYGAGDHPMMWKFWQPGIAYGDSYGTFNEAIFRSAEAYLIAAEAILKGAGNGKLGTAEAYYNKVVDRALKEVGGNPKCAAQPDNLTSLEVTSYRATAANISIDMILDERARELMGEYSRWFDLKRTGKLIERVNKYNPWAQKSSEIGDRHYLRPIPQSEIDLSFPTMSQNEGY
ncbi:RagB/SusD family nutrient uptake outer membrane protein [Ravibacter arvi]|uniref:RagB/SusD family nutrient uptake outer membrane protein n=1 Tax=Ravibacter arvi TaxID=2051041 RepID=A0ABP8LK02_9BACT